MLVFPAVAFAQTPKRVLVVYWYDKDYPWNTMFDQRFRASLNSAASQPVEYYAEYLETNRFPPDQVSAWLHDYLRQKYADRQPDVVVATSDTSLDFLLKYRGDLFTQTPLVFVATKPPPQEMVAKDPGMTGVISINAYRKTLDLALGLHPHTEQVLIISGTPEHDGRIESLARADLQGYQGTAKINYLTDIPPEELVNETKRLPERSLILYIWQQSKSATGTVTESMDILSAIAQSAQVPIYRLSTPSYAAGGIVGGYVNTAEANASKVAELVLRITSGTRATDIPIADAPTELQFDWRELQRWGIDEGQLPVGSIVRFREVTFWDQYKGRITGVVAIMVLQALLIAGLLFQRNKRWRANQRLAESEERFAKAFKANPQPMSLTTLHEGRYLDVNESFLTMSGYERSELIGKTSVELGIFASKEERLKTIVEPLVNGTSRNFEMKFRTRSGDFRLLLSSAELIELGGEECIVVASIDITERKQAEQQLVELTGRLLRAQDDERRHIARELHDGTAQNIGLIMLNLAQVQNNGSKLDSKMADRLNESLTLGEQALREIRTLSYVLHPPLLDQAGLVTALKWYVKGFIERSGVKVVFTETGSDGHRLPPEVEYAFFRVVQECLTNIRRHSNSETAEINLKRTPDDVVLSVRDHGKGSKIETSPNDDNIESIGVGIPGMRHRLKQLGGELLVETNGNGTTVTATVPVHWVVYTHSPTIEH